MLPIKKRPFRGAMTVSNKRLRRIEQQVYRNRPEMQSVTVSYEGTLAAGGVINLKPCSLESSSQRRTGDKIRVYRIEIRGQVDPDLDGYLIQKKTTADPSSSMFGTVKGAFILDSENTNRFTEWRHYRNINVASPQSPIKLSHSFKGGIQVKYNGLTTGSCVDNEIIWTFLNRDVDAKGIACSMRMWYTDA